MTTAAAPGTREFAPDVQVAIASLGAILACFLAAVGIPPSETSDNAGLWLAMEPWLVPLIASSCILAVAALPACLVNVRLAGIVCLAACACSWCAAIVAIGLEQGSWPRLLALNTLWHAPSVLLAAEALLRTRAKS